MLKKIFNVIKSYKRRNELKQKDKMMNRSFMRNHEREGYIGGRVFSIKGKPYEKLEVMKTTEKISID